jgi:hypothetical protein
MVFPDWLSCSRGEARNQSPDQTNFVLAQQRFLLNPSLGGGQFCSKLRATHRGTSLGPFVCGAKYGHLRCPPNPRAGACGARKIKTYTRIFQIPPSPIRVCNPPFLEVPKRPLLDVQRSYWVQTGLVLRGAYLQPGSRARCALR